MGTVQRMRSGNSFPTPIVFFGIHDIFQKAVKNKGLDVLLDQARAENPLKEPPSIPSPDKAS